jgi:hypothetical protein
LAGLSLTQPVAGPGGWAVAVFTRLSAGRPVRLVDRVLAAHRSDRPGVGLARILAGLLGVGHRGPRVVGTPLGKY